MSANICPNCGMAHSAPARFCNSCGKELVKQAPQLMSLKAKCQQCNTPLRPGARFCPSCGSKIARPAPRKATPGEVSQPGKAATRAMRDSLEVTKLVVRWMGGDTQEFQITKAQIAIGRGPNNDVVINYPAVSGQHLILNIQPGKLAVTDLQSTNGTMLSGRQIPPGTPQPLQPGEVIRIGDLTGNSVSLSLEGELEDAVRALALGKLDLSSQASIDIGRDPKSYLPLNHPTVSFHHARIIKQNGGLVIRDLGSTNGTFLNGTRISQIPLSSGDVIQIGPFKLSYDAQQQSLAQSMRLGHRLDALQLGREVSKKRMILQDISMCVYPGEFVALVGGSGAGKSTLLKAMNGFEPANHGQMLLDGGPLYSKLDLYRTQMGYVPQDDIIHRELPVKLALWYAAKLRLPDARPAEIEARIQDALQSVDMVEHANKPVRVLSGGQRKRVSIAVELLARPTLFFLDEPTSGLDPGLEKKMMYDLNRLADEGRTIILVTHATANLDQCDHVAFLTHGWLSYYGPPNDALNFFGVQDFSDIYLKLSQEIDPARNMPVPPELQPYYSQRASSGKIVAGTLWADYYHQSSTYNEYVANRQGRLQAGGQAGAVSAPKPPKRARDSFIRQSWYLARRQFDLIRLDWRTLFILLLMMPLIGVLFGMVSESTTFTGERIGTPAEIELYIKYDLKDEPVDTKIENIPVADAQILVTMLALALTQGGTFSAAYEIVKERAIFKRERAVNLSVIAYVFSKVVVLGIFAVFQVASVLFVLGLMGVDLDIPGAVFKDSGALELFITLYLGVVASILFGLFISAVVPNTDIVLYVILVQLFVQIILGGSLFPIDSPMASKMTISYWTTVGIGSTVDMPSLNEKGMVCSVIENPMVDECKESVSYKTDTILKPGGTSENPNGDYEHSEENLVWMWTGLLMQVFLWGALTVIVQYRKKS